MKGVIKRLNKQIIKLIDKQTSNQIVKKHNFFIELHTGRNEYTRQPDIVFPHQVHLHLLEVSNYPPANAILP